MIAAGGARHSGSHSSEDSQVRPAKAGVTARRCPRYLAPRSRYHADHVIRVTHTVDSSQQVTPPHIDQHLGTHIIGPRACRKADGLTSQWESGSAALPHGR
jgi:hypothetical protein